MLKISEGSMERNLSFQLLVLAVCILKIFFDILLRRNRNEWRIGFDLAIGDSTREGMVS